MSQQSNGTTAKSEPVIAVRGVTKFYQMGDVEVQALRGVDLEIWPGELVAIMGPSGSGKTSIINLIPRFYDATEGSIRIHLMDLMGQCIESKTMPMGSHYLDFQTLPDGLYLLEATSGNARQTLTIEKIRTN